MKGIKKYFDVGFLGSGGSAVTFLPVNNPNGGGGGGGTNQKQPLQYIVGTTPGAPTAGTNTWVLAAFANSYVQLNINKQIVDLADAGNGDPYLTKPLASSTLTMGNYVFQTGDVLQYTLITPNP